MANLQEIIPAIFTGPNGERLTPEQIAQRQKVAMSLLGRATDTSPDAGGWASVLTKGILGYKSGADARAADATIKANAEQSQNDIAALLNGGTGFPSAVASGASPTSAVATGTPVSVPTGDMAGTIRQGLISRGLAPHLADAAILNFQDESGLNPGINEKNPIVAGSRGGYGLYQLTGPRRREYEAFAAQRGVSPDDVDAQLDFFMGELAGSEAAAGKKFLSAPDTATAAQVLVNDFLRPAPEHRQSRSAKYGRVASTPQEAIAQVSPKQAASVAPVQGGATFGGPELVYDEQGMRYVNTGAERVANPVAPYGGIRTDFGGQSQPAIASIQSNNFNDRWNAGAVTPEVPAVATAPTPSPAVANALMPQQQTGPSESLLAQNDMMLGGSLSPSGSSPVAQVLSGYFPDAPVASPQGVGNQMATIARILGSPYASNEAKQVALGMYQQQQAQAQAAQEQQRMLAQRQATAGALGINPSLAGADEAGWKAAIDQATRNRNTVTVGNTVYDANTGQPIIQGATERYQTITGQQAQLLGLDPNRAYNVAPDGKISSIGDNGVTVNVGGGEKFDEKLAELDAKAIGDVDTAGRQAIRNLGRINQLDELLKASPSGIDAAIRQRAGEWGIKTEGLDTLQAAQAAINSLVPEQRPAGSGPMSDADLELFKQSLPRTINQPGGNQLIINTMRGIAQYDAQGAEIIQRLRAREISREDAFRLLNERKNPLDEFKAAMAGQVGSGGWRDAGNGVRIRPKGSN